VHHNIILHRAGCWENMKFFYANNITLDTAHCLIYMYIHTHTHTHTHIHLYILFDTRNVSEDVSPLVFG
jgi:hypothetical protein